jgi:hypothetical protein
MEIYSLSDLNQEGPFVLRTGSGNPTNLAYRVDWAKVQPTPGAEDWTLLDQALAAVAEAGTKLSISIKSGIGTPDWVYAAGAQEFNFISTASYAPGPQRMPIPWDATYLSLWQQFVTTVGGQYGQNARVDHFALTGMNSITQETLLPRTVADEAHWRELGYTTQKIEQAWQKMVEFWSASSELKFSGMFGPGFFPFNPPDTGIALIRMLVEHRPMRSILMNNALSAAWLWDELVELAGDSDVAFQMVGGGGPSVRRALTDAEMAGAKFVEVYPHDLRWL